MKGLVSALCLSLLGGGCASSGQPGSVTSDAPPVPDAPVVAQQPGAWFDADGGLMVVGAGRRLRLVLSAPIAACAPAFQEPAAAPELAQKASLPFRVLNDACRQSHPNILLPEEGDTASPSELERSYREVAHCAAQDLAASLAWVPSAIAASDPCPLALGNNWRLPEARELSGLDVDDRKAIAGALFDMQDGAGFGSLLLYARGQDGQLELATLSPNSSERAPTLDAELRDKPLIAATLRCVRASVPQEGATRPTPPPLPHAAECLRVMRAEQASLKTAPAPLAPELTRLEAWVKQASTTPAMVQTEAAQRELSQLLATPAVERLASEAREERALTERYAEVAERIDDPTATPGERERRRAEFDSLRKRLAEQLSQSAVAAGAGRRQLAALLARLEELLESHAAPAAKPGQKPKKPNPGAVALAKRVNELQGASPSKPPSAKAKP